MSNPAQAAAASRPALPNELLLEIINHSVPPTLDVLIVADHIQMREDLRTGLGHNYPPTPPDLAVANIAEWRSTRGLLNLDRSMSCLTGRKSKANLPSTMRIRFKNSTRHPGAKESISDIILAKFERLTIEIPALITYDTWDMQVGYLILNYKYEQQGWNCDVNGAVWHSVDDGVLDDYASSAATHVDLSNITRILAQRIDTRLPESMRTSKVSTTWLRKYRAHVVRRFREVPKGMDASLSVWRPLRLEYFNDGLKHVAMWEKATDKSKLLYARVSHG
ncbi:unnamed protein product [Zymoseptoria tritici ST99CH_1A5]|uniref:Uncharacterized protein n=1 Tax=Zymoseptoria tritici ST99CH_1A5 TaxID=1276529 RepID=A0A1Y6LSV7_ZYMTR|nr:unnamed protein product [Zymoseptoria tritici ST99CH_1A5]